MSPSYHHGDLRRAILATAAAAISESGVAAISLRDLARRTGVSHAAPAHHFGDKAGLLTALAAEGFELLADRLSAAEGDLLEAGVAYVVFAVEYPAHFEVMFQPMLFHNQDHSVLEAKNRAFAELQKAVSAKSDGDMTAALAAWSIAHGFATLWNARALPDDVGEDPGEVARRTIRLLFNL